MTKKFNLHILYWSLPIILWVAQLIFTLNSNTQIRYEELADSIRNVFWLQSHKIYDGVSNGVGWYSTLLIVYKLFGFSLFTAKYFRLFLWLVSLLCLTYLLFKYLKINKAILPLLTIGLSPTMLFLNSTQTEYALDLQMIPIYLLLVLSLNFKSKKWLIGLQTALLGILMMVGAMAYPTFLYYVPLIGLIFLWKLKSSFSLKYLLIGLVSFLLPLIAIFAYLDERSRSLLIYDLSVGGGIFRGAGSLEISGENFSKNLGGFLTDLFVGGSSYHFEAYLGEFSLIFPLLAIALVFYNSYKIYKQSLALRANRYIVLALISGLAVLVLSSLTYDPSGAPGMRRYTPFLAAFYALFTFVWLWLNSTHLTSWTNWITKGSLFLLLLHHLIVFPINLSHLKDPSPIREPIWFTLRETPRESLDFLQEQAKMGKLNFSCVDPSGTPFYCRYVEGYAAVEGSCLWNNLDCGEIRGYDFKTDKSIPLSVDLWNDYYFEH